MNLELALIFGFILHFVGDYLLQNDWMAQNKTKSFYPAAIHAQIYSVSFLFILPLSIDGEIAYCIILLTHFLIDRFRLAVYWIKLMNRNWESKNFGYDADKPPFMAVWLSIIVDNTFHVLFNSLAIYLAYR